MGQDLLLARWAPQMFRHLVEYLLEAPVAALAKHGLCVIHYENLAGADGSSAPPFV